MAQITAGTAKNAVMILKLAGDNYGVNANAYMRGTSYRFNGGYDYEWGYWNELYEGAALLAANEDYFEINSYVRITLNNGSQKVEHFYTVPAQTGGTPHWALTSSDNTPANQISGAWTYDNAYYQLVSFTSLDATEYTISYNANGGSVSPTSAVYSGTPLTLPTPTRAGYTFNGWYTAQTGGTQVSSPYTPSANVTLYAQWTQIQTGLPLYVGDKQAQKLFIGSQEVIHLYQGNSKIF